MTYGFVTPQESTLSPLSFVIYILTIGEIFWRNGIEFLTALQTTLKSNQCIEDAKMVEVR